MRESVLLKERRNSYIDHFLVGCYDSGTPFSEVRFHADIRKVVERGITDNPLRIRKVELMGRLGDSHSLLESLCYLTGLGAGLILAPVDAIITAYNVRKDKRRNY